jgi:hypothetical protein
VPGRTRWRVPTQDGAREPATDLGVGPILVSRKPAPEILEHAVDDRDKLRRSDHVRDEPVGVARTLDDLVDSAAVRIRPLASKRIRAISAMSRRRAASPFLIRAGPREENTPVTHAPLAEEQDR